MKNLLPLILTFLLFSCSERETIREKHNRDLAITMNKGKAMGIKIGRKQILDSLAKVKTIPDNQKYYYAADYGLPEGRVTDFSPSDEYIKEWRGKELNEDPPFQIYIHILDNNGVTIVKECSYEAWLTIYEGAILK